MPRIDRQWLARHEDTVARLAGSGQSCAHVLRDLRIALDNDNHARPDADRCNAANAFVIATRRLLHELRMHRNAIAPDGRVHTPRDAEAPFFIEPTRVAHPMP